MSFVIILITNQLNYHNGNCFPCTVALNIIMPGLHLQRNRRKSAIQKIYDGRINFNDGCVASGVRLLRRLRCSTLTTGP